MDKKLVETITESLKSIFKRKLRIVEEPLDITYTFDQTVTDTTVGEIIDLKSALNGRLPRFIRILCASGAALRYQTENKTWTNYPEGLNAGTPLRITNEAWKDIQIIPVAACRVRVYASSVEVDR